MKSYHGTSGGGLASLVLREHPVPEPGLREVLVRVRANSLNARELSVLRGTYPLPVKPDVIMCADGAGSVEAVGPQVTRFSELKVGDRIRASYFESVVLELRKPGEAAKAPADTLIGTTGGTAKPPAAGVARRQTATVTVLKVDQSAPSITVQAPDGRTVTRKVNDKNAIANVKAGDRIDVTYTEALVATVEPVK